ncbi:uncharacterized protein LOC118199092 [Stegodyphus dumicola]|uniref:uncharacterized protein LOC118199092 n=2 Tax=Stegodyphus dumicola TaxID=202533 RepID=UPI0015A9E133|nr:uncharacterized protein LOC118199092 [Stegodyphus dumicola]
MEKRGILINDNHANGNLCLFQENPEEIHMLLGADTAAQLFTERIEHFAGDYVAFETKLGWTLMGKIKENANTSSSLSVLSLSLHVSDTNLSNLWRLDTLGISSEENKTKSVLEEETRKHFLKSVKRDSSGRYEVTLPFILDKSVLSSNRTVAERHLVKTESKLINTRRRKDYEEIFDEWEAKDIIEVVTEEKEEGVHYLSHRPVIKESSETTKIRPVFNASARSKNSPSLNDCLRVSSDIEKAFCQIKIAEKDRDFLRFLWFDNQHKFKIYRHNRVVFGLTSSPFLLAATLSHLLTTVPEKFVETSNILKDSFYLDNSLISLNHVDEAENFVQEARLILASGHFNLRCWRSNFRIDMIDEIESKTKVVPVLGLVWDLEKDSLSCKIEETFNLREPITKRKVLSITQKIFDPIGFTAPITVIPKLILQETWNQKIKWDEDLPLPLSEQFGTWLNQLPLLSQIEIPRWLNIDYENEDTVVLHVFSDASKRAYATCAFLRAETIEGVKVQLVSARSRIAPIKELTIPRLELLSCLIGARLAKTILSDLKLKNCRTVFWSDSSTALGWIRRDQAWGTFVHNRVQEIRSLTRISDWRHVPGSLNPADLPSRGCTIEQLQKSAWWEGPSWLYLPEDEWPHVEEKPDEELINKEKRKTILTLLDHGDNLDRYYKYFSSYRKTVRMIAWIFRFYHNLKNKDKNLTPDVSVDELENAEKALCRLVQKESFTGINDPAIRALRPIVDQNGILRAKTNVLQRQDNENFRYPIILPSKHILVERLIYEKHLELQHAGVSTLMTNLRENFWILKSRKSIRNIIRKCVRCKRFVSQRVEVEPGFPPEDRVREGELRQQAIKKGKFQQLQVGDVVLLEDSQRRRIHWPLAKIVELFPSKDGIVRLARVKTRNGILLRPVPRLFPLEISTSESVGPPFPDRAPRDRNDHATGQADQAASIPEPASSPRVMTRAGRVVRPPHRLDLCVLSSSASSDLNGGR